MDKRVLLILIAAEVLIFIAMLLADFGVISTGSPPLSPKSIILHITTVFVIIICIRAYKRGE